jgi:DNA phosphorothioation-associated putative methyltransferase
MDGILTQDARLFDYGCGRGDDLRILEAMGYRGSGWDPVHRPEQDSASAPVVNLGYVVNVIENPQERRETLERAWSLTEQVLIVSARLTAEASALSDPAAFGDG